MVKSALITGGTKGIGLAVANVLAKRNYVLVLSYAHDDNHAQAVASDLLTSGATAVHIIKDDGLSLERTRITAHQIIQLVGSLDVVIFNAGITDRASFETMELKYWTRIFDVNLHYPVFLLQALLSHINRGGVIIFTGSMMGIYPHSLSIAYGVSKSAVHTLVQNLVKHLEPYYLRVCAIAPGFVNTAWQKSKPKEIQQNIKKKVALHRFAEVEEISNAYLFVIDNTYCNGEVIQITGGYNYN